MTFEMGFDPVKVDILPMKDYIVEKDVMTSQTPEKVKMCGHIFITSYEPRHKKTGIQGFRPGLTQTGLYILRKLES